MIHQQILDYLLDGVDFISSELKLTRSQVLTFVCPDLALRPVWLMRMMFCSQERIDAEDSIKTMIKNSFWSRNSFWERSSHNVRGTNWAKTYSKALTRYPTFFYNRITGWEQDPVIYNALYALLSEWQRELSDFRVALSKEGAYSDLRQNVEVRKSTLDETIKVLKNSYRSRLIYDSGNGFRAHVPIQDGHEDTRNYRDASRKNIAKPLQKIFDQSICFKLVQYGEAEVAKRLTSLRLSNSRLYERTRDARLLRLGFDIHEASGVSIQNQDHLMEIIVRIWLVRILKEMGWKVDHENSVDEIGARTVLYFESGSDRLFCDIMKSGVMKLDLLRGLRTGDTDKNGFQPDVVLLFSKNCEGERRGFMVLADSKNYTSSTHDVADRAMILYLIAFHWAMGLDLIANFPKTEDEKDFYPFKFNSKNENAFDFGMLFFPFIEEKERGRRLISHFQLKCLSCGREDSSESRYCKNCSGTRMKHQLRKVVNYLTKASAENLPLYRDEGGWKYQWSK